MAIGVSRRDASCSDPAAAAGKVLNHDIATESLRQMLREQPREHVIRPAGACRYDKPDWSGRI